MYEYAHFYQVSYSLRTTPCINACCLRTLFAFDYYYFTFCAISEMLALPFIPAGFS